MTLTWTRYTFSCVHTNDGEASYHVAQYWLQKKEARNVCNVTSFAKYSQVATTLAHVFRICNNHYRCESHKYDKNAKSKVIKIPCSFCPVQNLIWSPRKCVCVCVLIPLSRQRQMTSKKFRVQTKLRSSLWFNWKELVKSRPSLFISDESRKSSSTFKHCTKSDCASYSTFKCLDDAISRVLESWKESAERRLGMKNQVNAGRDSAMQKCEFKRFKARNLEPSFGA